MSTSTSTSTTYSSVLVDGKMTTTKTVTTKGSDGQTHTETFIEQHADGKSGETGADLFKMRIKDFREDEKIEKTEDFKGNTDGVNNAQTNKMSSSTSTSSSTVIKNGKMITTKTVTTTGPDGKTTTETFVEEKDDDKAGQIGQDFFKMRIKDLKDDERKDKEESSDENEDTINDGCKSSTDEESNDEFSTFQLDCLKSHNTYRANHGVRSLQLSGKLCGHAQEWADKLMAENLFQHRPGQKYGENIYSSWSSTRAKIRGGDAVDSWYKEIEQHTFGEEARSMNTGHFTQVVWAASMRLGVGLAKREGKVIVVANYDPPGNFRGRYVENVPPPL